MWVGGSSYSNLDTVAQDIPKASGPAAPLRRRRVRRSCGAAPTRQGWNRGRGGRGGKELGTFRR